MRRLSLIPLLLVVALAPIVAIAQDVDAGTVLVEPQPPSIDDIVSSTSGVLAAAKSNRWALLVVLIVAFASRFFGWAVGKLPWGWAKKLAANNAILDKWVPIVGSVAGALATTLAAGKPLTLDLMLQALVIGMAAAGWKTPPAAPDAAAASAAAAVKSPQDVLDVLGGPQK
ncbi:MAG: hypothetical protein KA310_03265 [Pseudomonadales bacterium]|nr:hypothetical protein [Pseudomonadales bacterium]